MFLSLPALSAGAAKVQVIYSDTVAVKRLSFVKSDGSVDVVSDCETLELFTIFDLTSVITVS
jgi:hypothetical protein